MGWSDDDTTVPDESAPSFPPSVEPDAPGDPFENAFTDEISLAAGGDWDIEASVIWDDDEPPSGTDGDVVDLPPA